MVKQLRLWIRPQRFWSSWRSANRQAAGALIDQAAQAESASTLLLAGDDRRSHPAGPLGGDIDRQQHCKASAGVHKSLGKLRVGDLRRDLSAEVKKRNNARRDELGDVGRGLGGTQAYLASMADLASKVADGDLTMDVQPFGEKDELGQAFLRMVTGLSKLVGAVASGAELLNTSSAQLAGAAGQTGEATAQITVNRPAGGQGDWRPVGKHQPDREFGWGDDPGDWRDCQWSSGAVASGGKRIGSDIPDQHGYPESLGHRPGGEKGNRQRGSTGQGRSRYRAEHRAWDAEYPRRKWTAPLKRCRRWARVPSRSG